MTYAIILWLTTADNTRQENQTNCNLVVRNKSNESFFAFYHFIHVFAPQFCRIKFALYTWLNFTLSHFRTLHFTRLPHLLDVGMTKYINGRSGLTGAVVVITGRRHRPVTGLESRDWKGWTRRSGGRSAWGSRVGAAETRWGLSRLQKLTTY